MSVILMKQVEISVKWVQKVLVDVRWTGCIRSIAALWAQLGTSP